MSSEFREVGKALSNWGRWGEQDRIGTLNLITSGALARAAATVSRGVVFDLGLELGPTGPQAAGSGRPNAVHQMSIMHDDFELVGGITVADDSVQMPLQVTTQWDGLAHIGYDGLLYNGVPTRSVTTRDGSTALSIHQLAQKGVAGRGVLLDVARHRGVRRLAAGDAIGPAELDAVRRHQGVELHSGDILLLRTGWITHYTEDGAAEELWKGEPGLSLDCAAWLNTHQVAAVMADNWGVEVQDPDATEVSLPLHGVLIRDMGMILGELVALEHLAEDCAACGSWEFFVTASPLKVVGGVGSPITPVAVR